MKIICLTRRNIIVLVSFCVFSLLSACTTTSKQQASSIEERATARWGAMLSGDIAGAYEFLSPGIRSSVTLSQYQQSIFTQQVKWTDAQYSGSECTESICKVRILLGFAVRGALPGVKSYEGTQPIEESWVLIDREWYLVPD